MRENTVRPLKNIQFSKVRNVG